MRLVYAALEVMILLLISPLVVLAQSSQPGPSVSVPRLINISGVFRPADGQPPGRSRSSRCRSTPSRRAARRCGRRRRRVALDATGRFTLLLGATHADGIPPAVFASGEAQWLGTLFARAGEVERPRVRITSVPYALRGVRRRDARRAPGLGLPAGADRGATARAPRGSRRRDAGAAGRAAGAPDAGAARHDEFPRQVRERRRRRATPRSSRPAGAVGLGTTTPLDSFHVRFTNTNGGVTGLAVQNLGNTATSYSGMLFYDQNGALGQFQGFNNVTHEYRINNIARVAPAALSMGRSTS